MMMFCGQSNPLWHWAAGKYPGKVGMLLGPSYFGKQVIRDWMPYVLDNDAFTRRHDWSEDDWFDMLWKIPSQPIQPEWVIVPDVVGDPLATRKNWDRYAPKANGYAKAMAYVVQPGSKPEDVPENADIVFVGGGTPWRFQTIEMWANEFPRVHLGAVNQIEMVWRCDALGVESVDGTGWFRDPSRMDKLPALRKWIEGDRGTVQYELQMHNAQDNRQSEANPVNPLVEGGADCE
jgi:hypothetical protein